ncbi:MAG: selenium cofactor biosynthesis protein YqeC [Chloroflexota bacterium]
MRLADALRAAAGSTLAFVGAGGKSSAMLRLAHELASEVPLLLTCTTHLALEQSALGEVHLVAASPDDVRGLQAVLSPRRTVLLTGTQDPREPKWTGLATGVLRAIHSQAVAAGALMLVEADGARGRSLKAPAAHEPVIPPFADQVVVMVGLDAVGARIDSDWVHRPERVAALLDLQPSARLEPRHIARVLTHAEGGLKGVPLGCEVRVLINKADDESLARIGLEVAEEVVRSGGVRAAVVSSLVAKDPVREVVGRVAGVILAAGSSQRLSSPKQLVTWRGRPLVWHAVRAAIEGGLAPIVVVLGAEAEAVGAAVSEEGVRVVHNPAWESGQSTSLRAGLAAVEATSEAVVFLLADMPRVDGHLVRALVGAHRRTMTPVVAPRAGGRWANPVLFDRAVFPALAAVEGDRGGRALYGRYPVLGVDWSDEILLDVDTPEDLARLQALE